MTKIGRVKCLHCQKNGVETLTHALPEHLRTFHDTDIQCYQQEFGEDTPLVSNKVWEEFLTNAKDIKRTGTTRFVNVIRVGNVSVSRQEGDKYYTFPRPDHYVYPKEGLVSSKVSRVARAFKYQRSLFIYGPAGAGKSAVVRALCNDMNLESSHYPMRDGLDTELYIGQMVVEIDEATGNNVTKFKKGKLLQDLEGRIGLDGIRRGVVILLDDVDRAPAEYHEILRHCLEDNAKNIFVPELGVSIELHPDTMIVATANSAGRGDTSGLYSSVQEMDESILDRFQRVVQFQFMSQELEIQILHRKFPALAKAAPEAFKPIMQVASILREMVNQGEIHASFSHRRIVQWLQSVEELMLEKNGKYDKAMLRESAQDWLEWYDETTRDMAIERALGVALG